MPTTNPNMPTADPVADLINAPWYQSTAGPGVSSTLMNLAGTFLPMANMLLASTGINLIPAQVNGVISLGVFVFFAAKVAIRYAQAKKMFGARLAKMQRANKELASALREAAPTSPVLSRGGY